MSTLNVDALVGNSSANAITVRGEGTATTSLQQGLAKQWVKFQADETMLDNFNTSSVADINVGKFQMTRTANLASANYTTVLGVDVTDGSDSGLATAYADNGNLTTSITRVLYLSATGFGAYDADGMYTLIHGDLA